MLGKLGKRLGNRGGTAMVKYSCPICGREIATFMKIEFKECLRCRIKKTTTKK